MKQARIAKQQNATIFDQLTDAQRTAIDALVSGASTTAAAKRTHVDRTTLFRWRTEDFAFQAALASRRRELRDEMDAQLLALAARALDVVANAVDAGDSRVALALLRGIGALRGDKPASECEDPAALQLEREAAEIAREERKNKVFVDRLLLPGVL